ncbi:hypothetical protein FRC09_006474 [Ceratobasidium sp. 395]|nr:hypothetical protein FRC09_006474 [Ceratobasidium sp. 395]
MSEVPDQFDGKVITNAHFVTQDGQAEAFENALKEIQKYALSDKEPGCLTYRVCRSGNLFLVFEEYAEVC